MEIPCVLMRLKRRGKKKKENVFTVIQTTQNPTQRFCTCRPRVTVSKRLNMGPGLFPLTLTFQLANVQFLHVQCRNQVKQSFSKARWTVVDNVCLFFFFLLIPCPSSELSECVLRDLLSVDREPSLRPGGKKENNP